MKCYECGNIITNKQYLYLLPDLREVHLCFKCKTRYNHCSFPEYSPFIQNHEGNNETVEKDIKISFAEKCFYRLIKNCKILSKQLIPQVFLLEPWIQFEIQTVYIWYFYIASFKYSISTESIPFDPAEFFVVATEYFYKTFSFLDKANKYTDRDSLTERLKKYKESLDNVPSKTDNKVDVLFAVFFSFLLDNKSKYSRDAFFSAKSEIASSFSIKGFDNSFLLQNHANNKNSLHYFFQSLVFQIDIFIIETKKRYNLLNNIAVSVGILEQSEDLEKEKNRRISNTQEFCILNNSFKK